MLERLKSALVESYVGAIALGLLFSEGIAALASSLTVPFRDWLQHLQHAQTPGLFATSPALRLQTILPELVTSALLLLAAFALLRWLYYPAAERPNQEQEQEPEESA